jgi:hypothetical protein
MKRLFEQIRDPEKIIIKDGKGKIVVIDRKDYSRKYFKFNDNIEMEDYYNFNKVNFVSKNYCPMSNAVYIHDMELKNEEEVFRDFINFLKENKPYEYIIQRYIDDKYPEESHISIIYKNDFME